MDHNENDSIEQLAKRLGDEGVDFETPFLLQMFRASRRRSWRGL